jgi:hypothetical protein
MRRSLRVSTLTLLVLLVPVVTASAEGWRSAQPPPPSPPEGQNGPGISVPLGSIGQISFWAPNRGLLITGGDEVIPAGLYYYNGVSWRELSTVCGGAGRIAWAGENDFWTISNQQRGQQGVDPSAQEDISLCHFENGQVVASYAEPIGVPDSYEKMDAAACSGTDDCWFAGETLTGGLNTGAFHLHWNGQTLSAVPSLETLEPQLEDPGYAIRSLVSFQGRFYESVQPEEDAGAAQLLVHRIAEGSSKPFVPLIIEGAVNEAGEREPFSFSGSTPLLFGSSSTQLWAAGGPTVTQLNAKGQFQQLKLEDPGHALADGITGIAAEPGSGDAWVSLGGGEGAAEVAQIQADGTVVAATQLPHPGEDLARKGAAGAIACPAQGDCWLATVDGWLFHLGGQYPEDDDPYFENLITYRPPDASIPFLAAEDYPEDDSGDNPPTIPAPPPPPPKKTQAKVHEALFSHVKVRLLKGARLALSFTLATKSHVRLLALRHKQTVASTRRYVLDHGRHTLKLHLSLRAWPNKLKLRVKAIGKVPLVNASSGGGQSGESNVEANTVGT